MVTSHPAQRPSHRHAKLNADATHTTVWFAATRHITCQLPSGSHPIRRVRLMPWSRGGLGGGSLTRCWAHSSGVKVRARVRCGGGTRGARGGAWRLDGGPCRRGDTDGGDEHRRLGGVSDTSGGFGHRLGGRGINGRGHRRSRGQRICRRADGSCEQRGGARGPLCPRRELTRRASGVGHCGRWQLAR